MSMVYDPVTKEFRPRLTPVTGSKARAAVHDRLQQQATVTEFERHRTRRHHHVRRRRQQQDLIFWSILVGVTMLLSYGIYKINKHLGENPITLQDVNTASPLPAVKDLGTPHH